MGEVPIDFKLKEFLLHHFEKVVQFVFVRTAKTQKIEHFCISNTQQNQLKEPQKKKLKNKTKPTKK